MRPLLGSGFVRSRHSTFDSQQHHDPDATPTRSRSTKPAFRSPLQTIDGNAKMRVPPKGPLGAKTSNGNMPSYDKQQSNSSRPLVPTLSATAKPSNRTPLTPRVAGAAPQTVTSPLLRRGARAEAPGAGSREDAPPTPVSSFLSNNITPRSGSRQSRVHSNNTTPTGTPNGTPVLDSSIDGARSAPEPITHGPGLGIVGMDKDMPKRPTVSFSSAVSDIGNARSPQNADRDSKFFFASDAKTAQPARPQMQTKNSSTFMYANGDAIPPPVHTSSGSVIGSMVAEERSQPKFFHANRTPDLASPNAYFPPPRPGSALSTTSRPASARLANPNSNVTFSPPAQPRPVSPSKLNQFASAASARSSPGVPPTENARPSPMGRGNSAPPNVITQARRISGDATSLAMSHARTSSSGSVTTKSPSIRNVSNGSSIDAPLASPFTLNPSHNTSVPDEETVATNSELQPPLSPIKTGHTLEQLNKLAANARRERKVLDLEITNSSLAAINRTLEREMRKQTAELRRYRRLSRSGRLSIATSASMRTSLGAVGDESLAPLEDMSEDEEDEDEEELSEDEEEETSDEGSLSPGQIAENDARHRKKDEKRLQLDLSKHQQLLIDSMKMNQSLKRCLGLTEELIGEGKKALEYNVKISDLDIGGRVLALDEVEERERLQREEMEREGLSEIGAQMLRDARLAAAWGGVGKDDRDSGIEVDGERREQTMGAAEQLLSSHIQQQHT